MKRIVLALAAFLLFEPAAVWGSQMFDIPVVLAAAKGKKRKRSKESQRNKNATTVRRELRSIHFVQEKLLRNKGDAQLVKVYTEDLREKMKKITPLLKEIKNIPGIKNMTDINALLKEGKKLVDDPNDTSDSTILETLQTRQIEVVEAYRKGGK